MKSITELSRSALSKIRPYEPGKPIEEVKKEYGLEHIVKLASNENPLGPSPEAVRAVTASLSELHLYPDGASLELKEALAKLHGFRTANITVGNGSDEIIKRIAEVFLNPSDQIVVANPTFSEYKFAAQLLGASVCEVPCSNGYLDLTGMRNAITESTKVAFICNPNNPTGTIVTAEEVSSFLKSVPSDVLVVFDEAYAEYVESSEYLSGLEFLGEYPNVIVLKTFSKIYGLASLRIGYAVANAEVISLLEKAREPFNVNRMAQVAALAALKDEEHFRRSREINSAGKRQLVEGFSQLGWEPFPSETNFILVNTFQDSRELFQKLLKQGIIIRPADIFGLPTYIRVTVGTEPQNRAFFDAIDRLGKNKEGEKFEG